jgi:Zn-dependent protease/predicted transcriptional regulator
LKKIAKRIKFKVHSTLLLIPFILLTDQRIGSSGYFNFIIAFLLTIVIHELAHFTAAKLLDLNFTQLKILPFGGLWDNFDYKSPVRAKLIFHFAPPLLNLLLSLYLVITHPDKTVKPQGFNSLIYQLYWWNTVIGAINLLPIFPLDLGTFLVKTYREKSSKVLTEMIFGEICSLVGIFVAISINSPLFFLIFFYLYIISLKLTKDIKAEEYGSKIRLKDVMCSAEKIESLQHGMRIQDAFKISERSIQDHFPVILHNGQPLGIVTRTAILKAYISSQALDYLSDIIVSDDVILVDSEEDLKSVLMKVPFGSSQPVIVTSEERYVGILFPNKLIENLLFKQFKEQLDVEEL